MSIAPQPEQKGIGKGKPEVVRSMLQNATDRHAVMKITGLEDDLAQRRHGLPFR